MKYKTLGNTDLKVSEIGLGCSYIGGTLERREKDPKKILNDAFDHGINFFDTADIYSQGRSEKILGETFANNRSDVIFATKVGFYLSNTGKVASKFKPVYRYLRRQIPWIHKSAEGFRSSQKKQDFSAEYIVKAVENSLKRMKTDYIDILQLHNPDMTYLENSELLNTLDRLKQDGKIRYYGVSCRTIDDAITCLNYPNISCVQVVINLVEQRAVGDLLPRTINNEVGVIVRQPLAGGNIVKNFNEFIEGKTFTNGTSGIKKNKIRDLKFLINHKEKTIVQSAMKYLLQLEGVSVVIVGTTNRDHLNEIVKSADTSLFTDSEMSRIRTTGQNI